MRCCDLYTKHRCCCPVGRVFLKCLQPELLVKATRECCHNPKRSEKEHVLYELDLQPAVATRDSNRLTRFENAAHYTHVIPGLKIKT